MNKNYNNLYPLLPPQLAKNWHITDILNTSSLYQVYIINQNLPSSDTNNNDNKRILKIVNETGFCKKIYKKAQSIKSPYIQIPLEIILYKHNYYIITKYQVNLKTLICQTGIQAADILNMAVDISWSLKLLHSNKILHLDCTPSNIYLNNDGSYCLGDFSSAIFFNSKNIAVNTTPGYTPPEIKQGIKPGCLADIYIFSCLLFTLFNNGYTTGCNNPYGSIKDNIPQELYSVILKGCSANPSERFSSIDEINQILKSEEIQDKISNCNYNLHITDTRHQLYYLKTSFRNSYTHTTQKKHKIHYYAYIVLILVTGTIFTFSIYSYITKTSKTQPAVILQNVNDTSSNITINELKELDISGTSISSVPSPQNASFSCSKLTILYASVNKIDDLNNIKYYTSLNELYLSDNQLTNLTSLETLCNLETLVLSYNNINDLSPVAALKSLINLDLSGNSDLHNIKSLAELYNLKTLNLTNTNITKKEIEFLNSNLPGCDIFY